MVGGWLPLLLLLLLLAIVAMPGCQGLSITVVQEECVKEEVLYAGDLISGNFAVQDTEIFWGSEHPGLDFTVTSPSGAIVYEAKDVEAQEFRFHSSQRGEYKFCFKNPSRIPEFVSFYIHVGHVPHRDEVAEDGHFEPVQERIAELREALEAIYAEQRYLGVRNDRHHRTNMSTKRRLVFYSLVEYLVLLAASILQVHFIRRLFSQRIGFNKL